VITHSVRHINVIMISNNTRQATHYCIWCHQEKPKEQFEKCDNSNCHRKFCFQCAHYRVYNFCQVYSPLIHRCCTTTCQESFILNRLCDIHTCVPLLKEHTKNHSDGVVACISQWIQRHMNRLVRKQHVQEL
jgi:hypothetical protein